MDFNKFFRFFVYGLLIISSFGYFIFYKEIILAGVFVASVIFQVLFFEKLGSNFYEITLSKIIDFSVLFLCLAILGIVFANIFQKNILFGGFFFTFLFPIFYLVFLEGENSSVVVFIRSVFFGSFGCFFLHLLWPSYKGGWGTLILLAWIFQGGFTSLQLKNTLKKIPNSKLYYFWEPFYWSITLVCLFPLFIYYNEHQNIMNGIIGMGMLFFPLYFFCSIQLTEEGSFIDEITEQLSPFSALSGLTILVLSFYFDFSLKIVFEKRLIQSLFYGVIGTIAVHFMLLLKEVLLKEIYLQEKKE